MIVDREYTELDRRVRTSEPTTVRDKEHGFCEDETIISNRVKTLLCIEYLNAFSSTLKLGAKKEIKNIDDETKPYFHIESKDGRMVKEAYAQFNSALHFYDLKVVLKHLVVEQLGHPTCTALRGIPLRILEKSVKNTKVSSLENYYEQEGDAYLKTGMDLLCKLELPSGYDGSRRPPIRTMPRYRDRRKLA